MDTNNVVLTTLMNKIRDGKIQLPDFQRDWVWDDVRINYKQYYIISKKLRDKNKKGQIPVIHRILNHRNLSSSLFILFHPSSMYKAGLYPFPLLRSYRRDDCMQAL